MPELNEVEPDNEVTQSVQLCLSCGICCRGILHNRAGLADEEIAMAYSLELPVISKEPGASAFALPCTRYDGDKCSIYPNRPKVCGDYRCDLLKGFENGSYTFDECTKVVNQIKTSAAFLLQYMGYQSPAKGIWDQIRDFSREQTERIGVENFHRTHARFLLEIKKLAALCGRFEKENFKPWTERKVLA